MRNRLVLFILTAIFLANNINAQQNAEPLQVSVKGIKSGSTIKLRWGPTNLTTWNHGIDKGYRIYRYVINPVLNTPGDTLRLVTTSGAIKPWPKMSWDPLMDSSDVIGLAGSALYSPTFSVDSTTTNPLEKAVSKTKEKENRFAFGLMAADQSFEVAKMMGLGWVDTDIRAGEEYLYKIVPAGDTTGHRIVPGLFSIRTNDSTVLTNKVKGIRQESGNKRAIIGWARSTDVEYLGYNLERSDNMGSTYHAVNQHLIVSPEIDDTQEGNPFKNQIFYQDSLPQNGVTYIYRVKGKNAFEEWSQPSDTIHVKGRPDPIGVRAFIKSVEDSLGILVIKWDFSSNMESQITNFYLYRTNDVSKPYVQLSSISKTSRRATDNSPKKSNYYIIKTKDVNGYELESLPVFGQIKDSTPPAKPTALTGISDPSGRVTLLWKKGTEEDLKGYRVFTSNRINGEYIQVSGMVVPDTTYKHTVDLYTLSRYTYYKIAAVDFNENRSVMSDACTVQIPDIIPPVPPVITNTDVLAGAVDFKWVLSTSDDILYHELQRKRKNESQWQQIRQISVLSPIYQFRDTTVVKGAEYQYRFLAVDQGLLYSSSRVVDVKLPAGPMASISNLEWFTKPGSQKPILRWIYPDLPGLYDFQIFRRKSTTANTRAYLAPTWEMIVISYNSSVNGYSYNWEDLNIDASSKYYYKVMARFVDGSYSPITSELEVQY